MAYILLKLGTDYSLSHDIKVAHEYGGTIIIMTLIKLYAMNESVALPTG